MTGNLIGSLENPRTAKPPYLLHTSQAFGDHEVRCQKPYKNLGKPLDNKQKKEPIGILENPKTAKKLYLLPHPPGLRKTLRNPYPYRSPTEAEQEPRRFTAGILGSPKRQAAAIEPYNTLACLSLKRPEVHCQNPSEILN